MIEVNFVDRVPTEPGRVKLTPVPGQENHYIMERADAPIVEGTPLDKATFNSIIQSRLTGRYYLPTVTQREITNVTTNANPIPSSGWLNASKTSAALNGYELFSSPASVQSGNITAAFDGNPSTYWLAPAQSTESYIGFKLPSAMLVKKVKVIVTFAESSYYCVVQASNNGTEWADVSSQFIRGGSLDPIEVELTSSIPYLYYRIKFLDVEVDSGILCYSFEISQSTVITKQNDFVIDAFPTTITDHQRFTIVTPTINTVGVVKNTLNGRDIDVILQSNRRYELVSSWDTKYYAREM